MHETDLDLKELQELLDRSYEAGGAHLLSIHTRDRRLDAASVAEQLTGMRLLALATVTSDSRPICRATACKAKDTIISANPSSQTPLRSACLITTIELRRPLARAVRR